MVNKDFHNNCVLFVNKFSAPASDDELSQTLRSRSETPQKSVHRSQGQGQTGDSEVDTSSYRHNLLGGGHFHVFTYSYNAIS